jgi:hypothetical protein
MEHHRRSEGADADDVEDTNDGDTPDTDNDHDDDDDNDGGFLTMARRRQDSSVGEGVNGD